MKTGIIAASLKEVGIRLEERECEKIIFKAGTLSSAQLIRREVGMPSGPPAEFGESYLITSIIIESERVISVRNNSSSRVVCERKKVTGSLITEVCLGLVNTLLNWFANKQHISYLLSVNMLFNGLSSGPTSCLQILYLLAYLKKCLGTNLILEAATYSS